MALYNIESPGGYQLTGLTIPGVDILGSKNGYSLSRPWLFEDFDQLTYHEVSEDEYEQQLALFHSGRYEYKWEKATFDMAEHNELLRQTAGEVSQMRQKQKEAQAEMDKLENELMEKWNKEKVEGKVPMDKVEELMNGMFIADLLALARLRAEHDPAIPHSSSFPNSECPPVFFTKLIVLDPFISKITSPLNANVWKVLAKEGASLETDGVAVILEAMKLEISVRAEAKHAGSTVEKLLVRPNDVVQAGDPLVLVRVKER